MGRMSHRLHAALAGLAGAILAGACGFSTHGTLEPGQGGSTSSSSSSGSGSTSTTTTTTFTTSTTSSTTTTATGGTGGTGTTSAVGGGGSGGSTTTGTGGATGKCADSKKSAGETDVDCGGAVCPPCVLGQTCNVDSDCASLTCAQGVCCATACTGTCMSCKGTDNGGMNGTCANAVAGKDPDSLCDSMSLGKCDGSGMCSCANGIKDGMETDVDCGGNDCGLCGDGKTCGDSGDCTNAHCVTTVSAGKICCDQTCGGPCESCELANFVGACKPVPIGTDCGGGKGCNASQACVTGGVLGIVCGSSNECLSNQCLGMGMKHCLQNDPAGYPCDSDFDCASGTCNMTTHLCE